MEKETHIQLLIDKFWAGTASRDDRSALLAYLKNEDNEFKAGLEQSFGQLDDSRSLDFIGNALEEALRRKIFDKAGIPQQQKRTAKYWPMFRIAAAAAVILVAGTLVWLNINRGQDSRLAENVAHQSAEPDHFLNTSQTTQYIILPDSSTIALHPNSSVSCVAGYGDKKRELQLNGTAEFSVVPDKYRPFTVFANGYATTALGTKFIVSTREEDKTTIKLLSGRVVVHATATSRFAIENTYLKPGDELRVNSSTGQCSIVNLSEGRQLPSQLPGSMPQNFITEQSADLSFDQTPLTQVFARISAAANTPILTDGVNLRGLTFSGEFLPADSLRTILSIICEVNNLDFQYEEDRVVIKKK